MSVARTTEITASSGKSFDDALNKGNGDVLIDAVLHSKAWWFICGQSTLEVKGTVVKTRNNLD